MADEVTANALRVGVLTRSSSTRMVKALKGHGYAAKVLPYHVEDIPVDLDVLVYFAATCHNSMQAKARAWSEIHGRPLIRVSPEGFGPAFSNRAVEAVIKALDAIPCRAQATTAQLPLVGMDVEVPVITTAAVESEPVSVVPKPDPVPCAPLAVALRAVVAAMRAEGIARVVVDADGTTCTERMAKVVNKFCL